MMPNQYISSKHSTEAFIYRPDNFHKMEEEYFTKSTSRRTETVHHQEDGEISQKVMDEGSPPIVEEQPPHAAMITNNSDSFQGSLNAASLVRLLSSQTAKFDQLLQKNEAAQQEINKLKQGSDWLRQTCESLQQSEAKKTKEISMLERKVQDLENLVIEMKLNEAESMSREDHYKLQISNLQQLLQHGIKPHKQRNGASKFTQSLTLSSPSNIRSGEHPERHHLLTRSFSALFKKPDNLDKSSRDTSKAAVMKQEDSNESNSKTPKVAASKPSHLEKSSSKTPKQISPLDETIAKTVSRPIHPSGWYNPKRSINRGSTADLSDNSDTSRDNICPIATTVPTRRATHLSNITDLTEEGWEETEVDGAVRSFGSDSSLSHSELNSHPVFEPAGPQLKQQLSFRGSGTQRKKGNSRGEAISKNFLSYC